MTAPRKTKIYLTILILMIFVVVLLGYSTAQSAKTKPKSFKFTPVPMDLLNPSLSEIQILEMELQGDLDQETRMGLEEKLKLLYSHATEEAMYIQQLTSMPENTKIFIPPTFDITEQRKTGIIQNPSVPFSSTEYKITNAWQEIVNGDYVLVFAGSIASDPEQGVLVVMTTSPHRFRQYLAPDKGGAIKIVDVQDLRLVIHSVDEKAILYFDILAQKFVNSLDEVIPTATEFWILATPVATGTSSSPYP